MIPENFEKTVVSITATVNHPLSYYGCGDDPDNKTCFDLKITEKQANVLWKLIENSEETIVKSEAIERAISCGESNLESINDQIWTVSYEEWIEEEISDAPNYMEFYEDDEEDQLREDINDSDKTQECRLKMVELDIETIINLAYEVEYTIEFYKKKLGNSYYFPEHPKHSWSVSQFREALANKG